MRRPIVLEIVALNRLFEVVFVESFIMTTLLRIFFGIARSEVDHQSSSLSHCDHRANSLLLSSTEPGDTSRKHAAVFSDILRQDQNVGMLDV